MTVRHSLIALVACLGVAIAAAPAEAQGGMGSMSAGAMATTPLVPWAARPVGTYDLAVVTPDRTVNIALVIADSAQTLTAVITTVEDGMTHPVTATVKGTDLTLVGDTPNGTLTIVLQQRDKKISGNWTLDGQSGTMSGLKRESK